MLTCLGGHYRQLSGPVLELLAEHHWHHVALLHSADSQQCRAALGEVVFPISCILLTS